MVVRMVAGTRYFGASAKGGDEDNEEARRCQKAISQFFHLISVFVVSDGIPSLGWLDVGGHEKAIKKTAKDLDDILESWLDEHHKHRARGGGGEFQAEGEQDFIHVMVSLQEQGHLSNFQYNSDTSIKSTCLALFLSGSDATAGTLTLAISLLLNSCHVMKKAQEELNLNIGKDRRVEDSDIRKLPYIQAIIKETLSLYPVGPLLRPREAIEDCNVSGYHVPAGIRLVVNLWKIHRYPRIWEDPCGFKPERFLTGRAPDVRGQNFELIPFGSGRRSCPCMSFALQVLHLTLAHLLQAFEYATPSDEAIDMTESPGLTIPMATPLNLLLSPRLPPYLYHY